MKRLRLFAGEVGALSALVRGTLLVVMILIVLCAGSLVHAAGIGRFGETQDLRQELYAMVIGVSRYRAGWAPLPGVLQDTSAVRKALEQAGFDTTVIVDPDRRAIEQAIAALREKLQGSSGGARLLIYYAGHGENLDGTGYLVPVDAPLGNINRTGFLSSALSLEWVRQQLLDLPVRHAIMLLDNCFSGTVFKTMRGTPLQPPSVRQMVAFPSREIISAGTEEQLVPDESIFRRFFEAALAGAADLDRDGYITGTELAIFLRSGVANESKGRQTPLFAKIEERGFHKGEFVIMSPLQGEGAKSIVREDPTEPARMRRAKKILKAGDLFRDCEQAFCPRMVALPSGEFMYGAPENEEGRSPIDVKPASRSVESFTISQYEVTFEQWDECFKDGGCGRWPDDMGWGRGGRPVINVSWQDATQFTEWLSRKTGQLYRLPTEIEWEYAARAGMTTARSWGDELGRNNANCRDCDSPWSRRSTAPVGSFAPNSFRLYDMLGNVWEWTGDCSGSKKARRAEPGVSGPSESAVCGIRGGSFSTGGKGVRLSARSVYPLDRAARNIGFRVVRDLVK